MAKKSKPNKTTKKAIKELEEGKGKKFKNVKDFMKDLGADDNSRKELEKRNAQYRKNLMKIIGLVKPDKNFKPQVFWNRDGDEVEVVWENVDYYGEWLNHDITLYKAQDNNRVIGVVISWISDKVKSK